jgi:hypothetical protein
MQIYHYHPDTREYLGHGPADPSPLEPGVWLIPANATGVQPPTAMDGKIRVWNGSAWAFEDIPAPPEPPAPEPEPEPEPEPTLEELFNSKMTAINAGKNRALDAGFLFTTGEGEEAREVLFDSDTKARLAYLELATKLGQDQTYATPWKASRGQWVVMDAALFMAVQPTYEAHIQSCFFWQAAREQELAYAYASGDKAAMLAVPTVKN